MPALVNARFLVPVFRALPLSASACPDPRHSGQGHAGQAQVETVSERRHPGPHGKGTLVRRDPAPRGAVLDRPGLAAAMLRTHRCGPVQPPDPASQLRATAAGSGGTLYRPRMSSPT